MAEPSDFKLPPARRRDWLYKQTQFRVPDGWERGVSLRPSAWPIAPNKPNPGYAGWDEARGTWAVGVYNKANFAAPAPGGQWYKQSQSGTSFKFGVSRVKERQTFDDLPIGNVGAIPRHQEIHFIYARKVR